MRKYVLLGLATWLWYSSSVQVCKAQPDTGGHAAPAPAPDEGFLLKMGERTTERLFQRLPPMNGANNHDSSGSDPKPSDRSIDINVRVRGAKLTLHIGDAGIGNQTPAAVINMLEKLLLPVTANSSKPACAAACCGLGCTHACCTKHACGGSKCECEESKCDEGHCDEPLPAPEAQSQSCAPAQRLPTHTLKACVAEGQTLLHMEQWDAAEDCFRDKLVYNPKDLAAILGLAASLRGNYEFTRGFDGEEAVDWIDVINTYNRAIEVCETSAKAYFCRAEARERLAEFYESDESDGADASDESDDKIVEAAIQRQYATEDYGRAARLGFGRIAAEEYKRSREEWRDALAEAMDSDDGT